MDKDPGGDIIVKKPNVILGKVHKIIKKDQKVYTVV